MVYILMATYNGEKYIINQLESIMNQTNPNFKLIIRDDCSTDSTSGIITNYIETKDKRNQITYINSQKSTGSGKKNFLELIKYCNNNFELNNEDYFMFSDQDDIWNKTKLESTLEVVLKDTNNKTNEIPILVHTDLVVVDQEGKLINKSFYDYGNMPPKMELNQIIIQNNVVGCTMMINRVLFDLLTRIENPDSILMHDHVAVILAKALGKTYYLDKPTMNYRQHENNSVGVSNQKGIKYHITRFSAGKKTFREDMGSSYKQVGYLIKTYPELIETPKYRLLQEYWQLLNSSKIKKLRTFKQYNIYKNSPIKKLMQKIWA